MFNYVPELRKIMYTTKYTNTIFVIFWNNTQVAPYFLRSGVFTSPLFFIKAYNM